ncbi:MAG TPA: TlpA disulfide reductase family protein [Pyrinomonadaceae bacterium]|jgi:thiol-disulfide isomerase/thioredoxin
MKRVLASFLTVACVLCAAVFSARATQTLNTAPSEVFIKLRGIDGKMYDVAEMKGKVVLVSFGATWCTPCTTELHALEELQNEYRDKPVRFLWVSLDQREHMSDRDLRDFAKDKKISFTVLRDATQLTYAQFSPSIRLPFVIFFDREGRLAKPRQVGMAQPEEYKKIIRDNLNKLLTADAGNQAPPSAE